MDFHRYFWVILIALGLSPASSVDIKASLHPSRPAWGDSVTASCTVSSKAFSDVIVWQHSSSRGNITVAKNAHLVLNGREKARYDVSLKKNGSSRYVSTLNISGVQPEDSGTLNCVMYNNKGVLAETSVPIQVSKHRRPEPQGSPSRRPQNREGRPQSDNNPDTNTENAAPSISSWTLLHVMVVLVLVSRTFQ